MDKPNLEDELNKLVKEFNPQHTKLTSLAQQAKDNHKKLRKNISNLQESLDYLRVCIKYQLFDLEATKRENSYLRKLLEERGN